MNTLKTHPCYRRILVVDDDRDICQLSAVVLTSSGYQVDTAEDGEAGWKALHAVCHDPDSYHLLITDHDMPRLSGLDLVKKLRSARMALPVILSSGNLPTEELQRNAWLEVAATLQKPFSIDQLVETVQVVLRAAESEAGSRLALPLMQLHGQPLFEGSRPAFMI
jgi:two-component system OmpR family response regulator